MPTVALPTAALDSPPPLVTIDITDDDAGTAQTVAAMQALISQGILSPRVRAVAVRITQHVRSFDTAGIVRAVCRWVQQNIKFRNDPLGADTLHTADLILQWRAGDCDDFCILIPAMLGSLGIATRLVAEATDPRRPEAFTHIYPEAPIGGTWTACDMARKSAAIGKRPARSYRRQIYPVDGGLGELGGLAGFGQIITARRYRRALGQMTTSDPTAQLVTATGTSIADILAASHPQSSSTFTQSTGSMAVSTSALSGTTLLLIGGAGLVLLLLMTRR